MKDPETWSCEMIEEGVNICPDSLSHCCTVFGDGQKGQILIGEFSGDVFPVQMLQEARTHLRELHQGGRASPCRGCPGLSRKVWKKPSHPLRIININDWSYCNLACKFCAVVQKEVYAPLSEEMRAKPTHDLLSLIRDMVTNNYLHPKAQIFWGGGEVAIYKSFGPVAEYLMQKRYHQLVNTNGLIFSKEIEKGLRNRRMTAQISVDAGTRETYLRVKGRDAFDDVWENIRRYSRAGKLIVKYILQADNCNSTDVTAFIDQCKRNKVRLFNLVYEQNELNDGAITDEILLGGARMLSLARKHSIPFRHTFTGPYGEKLKSFYDDITQVEHSWLLRTYDRANQSLSFKKHLKRLLFK